MIIYLNIKTELRVTDDKPKYMWHEENLNYSLERHREKPKVYLVHFNSCTYSKMWYIVHPSKTYVMIFNSLSFISKALNMLFVCFKLLLNNDM